MNKLLIKEYLAGPGPYRFWRLLADGMEFAPGAHPFSASDASIILDECKECGHCGSRNVIVRRTAECVVWFCRPDRANLCSLGTRVMAYGVGEYAPTIGLGDIRKLPELSTDELGALCTPLRIPSYSDALYRIPDAAGDPSGREALILLRQAFNAAHPSWRVHAAPAQFIELRIGLELPGVPESEWHVSRDSHGLLFMFITNPTFPLWIGNDSLDSAFSEYFRATGEL